MLIKTKSFLRKPFEVEAVEVTAENMADVAKWCRGQLRKSAGPGGRNPQKYIKVNVKRALNDRQTMAYVGDWVTVATNQKVKAFKVYTPKAFTETFDEMIEHMQEVYARMDERVVEEDRLEEEGLFPEEFAAARRVQ